MEIRRRTKNALIVAKTLMNKNPILNGLILHGGKSSRMGFDKGFISFHDRPQRDYLHNLLTELCDQVFVSCKSVPEQESDLNFLSDKFEIESPLNGILTAFEFRPDVAWLTVPVDMPGVDARHLQDLISNRDTKCFATCFFDSEGKLPEPLITIWEPTAFPSLKDFFLSGAQSPREFLRRHKVNVIPASSKSLYPNINTPEELENYKRGI
jgi:molybdenum cofactor guanylyltransferase